MLTNLARKITHRLLILGRSWQCSISCISVTVSLYCYSKHFTLKKLLKNLITISLSLQAAEDNICKQVCLVGLQKADKGSSPSKSKEDWIQLSALNASGKSLKTPSGVLH